jgi:hypothetical protein
MRHARDGRACLPRRSRWRNSDGLSGTASQRERRMGVGSSICAYVVGRDGRRVPVTIILWGSSALFHAPRPRVCDLASRVRGNTPMVTHLRPSEWPRRRGPPSLSVDRRAASYGDIPRSHTDGAGTSSSTRAAPAGRVAARAARRGPARVRSFVRCGRGGSRAAPRRNVAPYRCLPVS